jgi:hypothetical protein
MLRLIVIAVRAAVAAFLTCLAILCAAQPVAENAAQRLADSYDKQTILLIGELHGTEEIPALVAALVDRLSDHDPVTLGLEIPRQERERFDTFLQSDGSDNARTALLAGDFWQPPRNTDGRRSKAMVNLVESIQRLRANGRDIDVALLDDLAVEDFEGRNDSMAQAIAALGSSLQSGPAVVLMGNYHTRVALPRGQLISEGEPIEMIVPTVMRFSGIALTSVNVAGVNGTYWGCLAQDECGPQELTGPESAVTTAEFIENDPSRDGYHLSIRLPELTASPPIQ